MIDPVIGGGARGFGDQPSLHVWDVLLVQMRCFQLKLKKTLKITARRIRSLRHVCHLIHLIYSSRLMWVALGR
jgi:hypothetical protein